MARKSRFVALATALLAVTAGSAHAAGTEQLTSSWANVNICNPTQLGARAQLAGDGSTDVMHVRFTAEWLSPDGWVPLAGEATSPWQEAGSSEFTWSQAGWTFNIAVPETGTNYQLRAVAEMDLGSGRRSKQATGACALGG
jgi:ABC-type phosphate transport system substrate-binding protein